MVTKRQLHKQNRQLRTLVRFLLPEYEASAGMLPPDEAAARRNYCAQIRGHLRATAPKRTTIKLAPTKK